MCGLLVVVASSMASCQQQSRSAIAAHGKVGYVGQASASLAGCAATSSAA